MRRFILLSLACCLTFGIAAQTAREEIQADIHRSASNYYAYPTPSGKLTAPPKGYKPFYLSHYARHGSRFLTSAKKYERPLGVLREAERLGTLTPLGKQTLSVVDSIARLAKERYGELTPLGARQHRGIAERMYKNYPEVFRGNAAVDARSTVVIRCILSMTAECLTLQSLNPELRFTNDASRYDMPYLNYQNARYDSLRRSPAVDAARKAFQRKHVHPERLMNALFNNPDYVRWKIDGTELMSDLFEIAGNMQSHDTGLDLNTLFTEEERYGLWLTENYGWYLTFGPSPLNNEGRMPYVEANLLRNILDTADSCVVQERPGATLRFGHEVCVMPLACLLQLGDCGYQTTDPEQVAERWRNYRIFPMASNIQLVFYRKKGNDTVLVKFLLNEEEMTLPLASDTAPYYPWEEVEAYYRKRLAEQQ